MDRDETEQRLDVISNNIANASTLGYKKSSVTNQLWRCSNEDKRSVKSRFSKY